MHLKECLCYCVQVFGSMFCSVQWSRHASDWTTWWFLIECMNCCSCYYCFCSGYPMTWLDSSIFLSCEREDWLEKVIVSLGRKFHVKGIDTEQEIRTVKAGKEGDALKTTHLGYKRQARGEQKATVQGRGPGPSSPHRPFCRASNGLFCCLLPGGLAPVAWPPKQHSNCWARWGELSWLRQLVPDATAISRFAVRHLACTDDWLMARQHLLSDLPADLAGQPGLEKRLLLESGPRKEHHLHRGKGRKGPEGPEHNIPPAVFESSRKGRHPQLCRLLPVILGGRGRWRKLAGFIPFPGHIWGCLGFPFAPERGPQSPFWMLLPHCQWRPWPSSWHWQPSLYSSTQLNALKSIYINGLPCAKLYTGLWPFFLFSVSQQTIYVILILISYFKAAYLISR